MYPVGRTTFLLGGVLGNDIINSLWIIRMAMLLTPAIVPNDFYTPSLPMTLVIYGALVMIMYIKRKLNRTTGIMLLRTYLVHLMMIMR